MSSEPGSFQLNPGDRVGNYVIREQIGEGGFAIVYAAEQEKPVRRKVALKIIKLGMDTRAGSSPGSRRILRGALVASQSR